MPPCAFAELHACSEPFVATATVAPARSAETAAARPDAPLPITSTSKERGAPIARGFYLIRCISVTYSRSQACTSIPEVNETCGRLHVDFGWAGGVRLQVLPPDTPGGEDDDADRRGRRRRGRAEAGGRPAVPHVQVGGHVQRARSEELPRPAALPRRRAGLLHPGRQGRAVLPPYRLRRRARTGSLLEGGTDRPGVVFRG